MTRAKPKFAFGAKAASEQAERKGYCLLLTPLRSLELLTHRTHRHQVKE